MSPTLKLIALSLFVMGFAPSSLLAQRPPAAWTMGLGLVHITQPYRDVDSRSIPIPFISYRGKNFFFQGPKAGAQMTFFHMLILGVQGRYRFSGYEADDSDFLTGMDDRDDTLELGGLAKLRLPLRILIGVDVYKDVLGKHQGQEWIASIRRPFRLQEWMLIPSFAVNFLSSNTADYYYGVEPAEARAGRPTYEAPSSEYVSFGLMVRYAFSKHWSSMVSFTWTQLDSDIEESPIVDTKNTTQTLIGLTYKF